jgi:hypothetical protein
VSGVRLTRRGRLLLQTLPVFVVLAGSVQVLTSRAGDDRRPTAAATSPTPSPATTTTRPARTPAPTRPAVRPTARPTTPPPSSTARPTTRTPLLGDGRLAVVPGQSDVHGSGPLRRFMVEVEGGLPDDPRAFAAAVERVLFDARSWGGGGRLSFQRVSSGPVAFRVTLASPPTTDRLCRPLRTGGIFSCYAGGRAVLNAMRWHDGAASYGDDLAAYRIYMVNHEVGHALGHGHRFACGSGGLAPVMIQQTKSLYGCRKNPWPLADER